tara:strand:+ start:300 stop:1136 length:837 start_codon:yes stop_codon:yes gene_type:complete
MKISKQKLKEIIKEELIEAKKRDYKAEYKKFQSSTKSKKYRAELNKYNRQKGTYGNGDGKDASHKNGKIVGFEAESKNRGRAEKSRLKKESSSLASWSDDKKTHRWKVYIDGEKKPLILTGRSANEVKKFAHQMINNNKVKIKKVVKEGLDELGAFSTPSYTDLGVPSGINTGKKSGNKEFYQGFSSKEAKTVIDKELKDWAKQLRKVQGKVVKSWMQKAKSGVIDYFDLVRGMQTGDIRRAHPYETKFLMALLNKDKIMDRFRSYFGGKKGKRGRRK